MSQPNSSSNASIARRRLIVIAVAVAAVVTAGIVAFVQFVPVRAPGAAGSIAAGQGTLTVGGPAPDLTGTTLDGRTLSLRQLRGQPVVVNFWASWCPPCKREFPAFKSALARHAADGLAIVGVLFNDGAAPAQAFVTEQAATWPTLLDPSGTDARTYGVFGAPETFLIDRSGVVRARILGDLTESSLEQAVAGILR